MKNKNVKKAYIAPEMEVFPFVCEEGFSVSYIHGATMAVTLDNEVPEGYFDEGKNLTDRLWNSY